eukprot:13016833-Heterocapsa_arctica.AAC.1
MTQTGVAASLPQIRCHRLDSSNSQLSETIVGTNISQGIAGHAIPDVRNIERACRPPRPRPIPFAY